MTKQFLSFFYSLLRLLQNKATAETDCTDSASMSHWRNFMHPRLFAVAAALTYIGIMSLVFEYADVFEFNPDEGNNLIKSLLLDRGYSLGYQIWTDQPPGFTYLLWGVFKVFGWSVPIARLTVLFFAGIIVFVTYDVLQSSARNRCGHPAAVTGCVILMLSTLFVRLSVSVMIGLPAIAVMMLAVWSLNEYLQSQRRHWLVICGALMGFSMGIKLFTGFLVPIYATVLIVHHLRGDRSGGWRRALIPVTLLLSGCLGVLLICLSPILLHGAGRELLEPHLITRLSRKGDADGLRRLLRFIRQDGYLFTLALLGTFQALKMRKTGILLMSFWLFPAAAFLYDHSPIWSHHRLLLTVPGAILAGYALGEMLSALIRKWPPGLLAVRGFVPAIAVAGLLLASYPNLEKLFLSGNHLSNRTLRDTKAQEVIERYLPDIRYMVSARQIFAFRVNRLVPPNLAVTSTKRFRAQLLTADEIMDDIRGYRPEVILLSDQWKEAITTALHKGINDEYERVFRDPDNKNLEIWVLKALLKKVQ